MDWMEGMSLQGPSSYYLNRGCVGGSSSLSNGNGGGGIHAPPGFKNLHNPNISMHSHVGVGDGAVGPSVFHVENPSPNFPPGMSTDETVKKLGKFGGEGAKMSLALSPVSAAKPSTEEVGETKQKLAPLGEWMNSSAGLAFTPRVLGAGENNNFWLPNDSGSVANGEICYDNLNSTRIHQKRPHQWFTGPCEQELFLNKKQAVESVKEAAVMENSLWNDGSIFQTEATTPSPFNPKPVQGLNLSDKGIPPVISASMNMENDPAICLSMSRSVQDPLPLDNYNINPVVEQNFTSICPAYSTRGHENFFATDPFYSKAFVNPGPSTNIAFCSSSAASLGSLYNKENNSSMVDNSEKDAETTISFGGFQNNIEERDHSGKLVSSYDFLLSQPSGALLEQKDSADEIRTSSKVDKNKDKDKDQKPKKGSSNNFPSNVKSLMSTGILDGVPVKYVSWSREKNLRGVINGTGYMCSCHACNLTKSVNAYDFEQHAGCKTKHPNNHIYFENGKTIYAVVQELKSTPQEMLFDVIQNVTGSPVNQRNFNTWKASYQAATRELQRIYGKDDPVVQS